MDVGWDDVNKQKWRTEIDGFWKLKSKWEREMVGDGGGWVGRLIGGDGDGDGWIDRWRWW